MRLILSILAAAVVSGPIFGQDSVVPAYTSHQTWLRQEPSPVGRVVAMLPSGAIVRVGSCGGAWCEAEFRQFHGFVEAAAVGTSTPREPVDAGRGYINSRGQWIPSPTWTVSGQPPDGATAQCADGAFSFSQSRRGTCSHHGGVQLWL